MMDEFERKHFVSEYARILALEEAKRLSTVILTLYKYIKWTEEVKGVSVEEFINSHVDEHIEWLFKERLK